MDCTVEMCPYEPSGKVTFTKDGEVSSVISLCKMHWGDILEKLPIEYVELFMSSLPDFRDEDSESIQQEIDLYFGS